MIRVPVKALLAPDKPLQAPCIAFDVGLSFWGGFDSESGKIIDASHPGHGQTLSGMILCLPSGRGSSSSSSVLAEAIRLGSAPAAIVLQHDDPLMVTGALVAQMLYQRTCPVVTLTENVGSLLPFSGTRAALLRVAEQAASDQSAWVFEVDNRT